MDGFFAGVEQVPHDTSAGRCELPLLYRDGSQMGLLFSIELDRAERMLAGKSVEPWPVLGRALAAIYAWEYRDSSIGAYGEVGLGIQARQRGTSPSLLRLVRDMGAQPEQGIWVVDLPVTTKDAYVAGVELWGYPKYVAEIETRFDPERAWVRLGNELTVSIGKLRGPRLRAQPVTTFTAREGRLLRSVIRVDHQVQWGTGRSARLEITGDGPTARSARELGLDRARIVAAFRTDRFRAQLPAGVDVGKL